MEQHPIKLVLPTGYSFHDAMSAALETVIYPHMCRTGKNSVADPCIRSKRPIAGGMSEFTGTYLL